VNENLRRALLRARLSDEDVAARLEVDPKTVRRWLEGRTPYLRHRWALATMLAIDEADLWPQARATRSWPAEVQAIYPHRDSMPGEVWLDLFRSAEQEINILDNTGLFLAEDPKILASLRYRAQAGVKLSICLGDPDWSRSHDTEPRVHDALALFGQLRGSGDVQVRLHRVNLNHAMYRADDTIFTSQHAFGIPARRAAVLHLHRTDSGGMFTTYLETFNRICTNALPFLIA
jgi:transcriptional regulator with XRE-family HTH domain